MYFNYYNYYLDEIKYITRLCKQLKAFNIVINSSFNYVYKQLIFRWIIILIFARCRSPGLLLTN